MENEKKQVFQSKPITLIEQKLQEKLVEDIANQAALMDNMGKQLLTLELGMVGIYATILKLTGNETVLGGWSIGISFFLWFMSLVATVLAIFPESYSIDKSRIDEIEKFFHNSAKRKAKMLTYSVFLFFTGAVVSVLQ